MAPVVTAATTVVAVNATTLIPRGCGFSTVLAGNLVTFSSGAIVWVTTATPTQLTVTGLSGLIAGPLSASVTSNSVSSGGPVQVATVIRL